VVTHAKESKSNSIFMTAKKNLLPGGTGKRVRMLPLLCYCSD
jgi:hypothetical protein